MLPERGRKRQLNNKHTNHFIMISFNGHIYTPAEIKDMRSCLSESINIDRMSDMDIVLEFLASY